MYFGAMKKAILYSFVSFLAISCNQDQDTKKDTEQDKKVIVDNTVKEVSAKEETNTNFGSVQPITLLENTSFAVTLEDTFDADKNSIYAPTLAYCWEEIRNNLPSAVTNITSDKIQLLHDSKSFQNVLEKDEYQSSITFDGEVITAKASFNKTLPFVEAFENSKDPILFNNEEEVSAFGYAGVEDNTAIRFYDSDENFAISLKPKDKSSRIILMKTDFSKFNTLHEVCDYYQNAISKYNNKETVGWKRRYTHLDITKIPKIHFNIENDFPDVVNSTFESDRIFKILKFYQRNAFILNESGAKMESEAEIYSEGAEEFLDENKEEPQPKRLIFDQSFVVFLQKTNSEYPYFMVYITDLELLEGE